MQSIYEPTLELPDSLTDEKIVAAARALEVQLKSLSNDSRLTLHLPRLAELSGEILNLLASQFHVDCFNATALTDDQKRSLIAASVKQHRLKGTRFAVEQVCNAFFDSAAVKELSGFLFRLKLKGLPASYDAWKTFLLMLFDAKNVRSHLESIEIDFSPPPTNLFVGIAQFIGGFVDIAPASLSDDKIILHAGVATFIGGEITIDSERLVPKGDILKLFFGFPVSRHRRFRGIALKNPREDVTRSEMKAIGRYVADNRLVMNAAGEFSNGVFAAVVKQREVIPIIEDVKPPRDDPTVKEVLRDLKSLWGAGQLSAPAKPVRKMKPADDDEDISADEKKFLEGLF